MKRTRFEEQISSHLARSRPRLGFDELRTSSTSEHASLEHGRGLVTSYEELQLDAGYQVRRVLAFLGLSAAAAGGSSIRSSLLKTSSEDLSELLHGFGDVERVFRRWPCLRTHLLSTTPQLLPACDLASGDVDGLPMPRWQRKLVFNSSYRAGTIVEGSMAMGTIDHDATTTSHPGSTELGSKPPQKGRVAQGAEGIQHRVPTPVCTLCPRGETDDCPPKGFVLMGPPRAGPG